jgi:hypothetical protein
MKNNNTTNEKLFSYGTLQDKKVQLSTFGRKLTGKSDILSGYKLLQLKISDPDVIITSGKEIHPMLVHTGNKNDTVAGGLYKHRRNQKISINIIDYFMLHRFNFTLTPLGLVLSYIEKVFK